MSMQQDTCGVRATSTYVREANLIEDRPILTALASRYLQSDADQRRYQWLYCDNPFGKARAWIACDKFDNAIGIAALFPRQMYCQGAVVPGWVLGDFCVAPEHRTLGPALQLQRACLQSVQSGEFAAVYDFPSRTMLAIYKHLGIEPIEQSVRMAKVLRADRIFRNLTVPGLSRAVMGGANFVIGLEDRASGSPANVEFTLQDGPCGPEYSELAGEVGSSLGICTVRSAEYLNWRYRRHPHVAYEFLAARRGGQLLAYCVFTQSEDGATVAEFFGKPNDRVLVSLLRKLATLSRKRGVATVSLPLLSRDPRHRLLRRVGFRAREVVPVLVISQRRSQLLLMHGDRES
ncbi:MAG: GNAT family N-acetyltransferase [Candidatus Korobacteraceae bacterium]